MVAVELWMIAVTRGPAKSCQRIIRHLFHEFFECAGGTLLQTVPHQPHAVKKQRKPAEEGDKIEYVHMCLPSYLPLCLLVMFSCKLPQILVYL